MISRINFVTSLVVVVSACSTPETSSRGFSEWVGNADTARVPADRLASCSALGDIVESFESTQLSRILDAKILGDGGAVIADALQHSLLIFANRAPPRLVGRQGSGPGEFENLRGLFLSADTLLAWDQRARRITALSARGDLLWTQNLDVSYGEWAGSFRGRMGSGHYPLIASASSAAGVEGPYRDTTIVLIARPDSAVVLGARFPSSYQFAAREGRGWRSHEQIFSPAIHLAVAGATAWIGDSSAGEIASIGPSGEAIRLLQLELTPRRATAEMVEAERLAIASVGGGTALESMADQVPARDLLPVFEDLRGSSDGRLLVVEYATESDGESRTWLIDPNSLESRCFTMVTGSRVLDSRGSLLLIETRDELGVPKLELRSIPGAA